MNGKDLSGGSKQTGDGLRHQRSTNSSPRVGSRSVRQELPMSAIRVVVPAYNPGDVIIGVIASAKQQLQRSPGPAVQRGRLRVRPA